MQMWHRPRITHPLTAAESSESITPTRSAPSSLADAPTMHIPTVPHTPPASPAAATARGSDARSALAGQDDPDLARVRELLVGPYLRDHERRLRTVERQAADLATQPASAAPAEPVSAEWQAQMESALDSLRRSREEQDQAHAFAVAQLKAQLAREHDDRADERRALELVGDELRQLRVELERERQARGEQTMAHARQLAEVAAQLDHQRESHVRLHAHQSTELDARLERERQHWAAEVAHARTSQVGDAEPLRLMLAEAERALVAMRDERQYLAGLLAELGLHLVRHAGSPAARADTATKRFLTASDAQSQRPG